MLAKYSPENLPQLPASVSTTGNVSNAASLRQTINSSKPIPTVNAFHKEGKYFVVVNTTDFDPDIHLYGDAVRAEAAELAKKEADMLARAASAVETSAAEVAAANAEADKAKLQVAEAYAKEAHAKEEAKAEKAAKEAAEVAAKEQLAKQAEEIKAAKEALVKAGSKTVAKAVRKK